MKTKARVLAYYLPQFHPIPENDEWWGKGFTEWTNVGKARKLFPGHCQPHVPADLGYYDLRVPETRQAQADLAREHGLEGFVYWHYWFGNGRTLLERPFNEVLQSGEPDFPFCLAWANETWSGTFHGLKNGKVLIEQTYPGDEDYIAHFHALLPAFKDKRYIKCEGKPVFFVYIAEQLPDAKHFIDLWNKLAIDNGFPGIYFVNHKQFLWSKEEIEKHLEERHEEGFDATNISNRFYTDTHKYSIMNRGVRKVFHHIIKLIPDIRPYEIESIRSELDFRDDVIPTVVPNWDHTPRSGKDGIVLTGSTPEKFQKCVRHALSQIANKPMEKRFLMIKSWNEWAEGNYMEPDLKWGRQYLDALAKEVLES